VVSVPRCLRERRQIYRAARTGRGEEEDFDISLEEGVLTVSGERKAQSTEAENLRSERLFGSFSRSITLSTPVKADAVTASYQDGVLTVSLPKAEEAKPRKIQVDLN